MSITKEDILKWLEEAKEKKATHLMIVCDTFDWGDYPVYVMEGEDVHEKYKHYHGRNMQEVVEVYDLSMDIESQIKEHRAKNF